MVMPKPLTQVDVLVAVDVPDLRALARALDDDLVDDLLPVAAGSPLPRADRPARRGRVCVRAFGQRRARIDALGQSLDVVLLPRREGIAPAPGEARSRHRRSAGRSVGSADRRFRFRSRRLAVQRAQLFGEQRLHGFELGAKESSGRAAGRFRGRCRECGDGGRLRRQDLLEMRGQRRHRCRLVQQLPEGDLRPELLFDGAGELVPAAGSRSRARRTPPLGRCR